MAQIAGQAPDGSKARRVYLLLRDEILGGHLAPGDSLPGELKLAEMHGVSRVTIRRALDGLESDGLIERRAGSGTSVRAPGAQPGPAIAAFAGSGAGLACRARGAPLACRGVPPHDACHDLVPPRA